MNFDIDNEQMMEIAHKKFFTSKTITQNKSPLKVLK